MKTLPSFILLINTWGVSIRACKTCRTTWCSKRNILSHVKVKDKLLSDTFGRSFLVSLTWRLHLTRRRCELLLNVASWRTPTSPALLKRRHRIPKDTEREKRDYKSGAETWHIDSNWELFFFLHFITAVFPHIRFNVEEWDTLLLRCNALCMIIRFWKTIKQISLWCSEPRVEF